MPKITLLVIAALLLIAPPSLAQPQNLHGLLMMTMTCPDQPYLYAGQVITCTYVLQNTSQIELWDVTVEATRSAISCYLDGRLTLGPWETMTCAGTIIITPTDIAARHLHIDAIGAAKSWINGELWGQVWSNSTMLVLDYTPHVIHLPLIGAFP